MKKKAKKMFTNIRIIVLLIALLLAVVSINPHPNATGVAVRNVIQNSSASLAGIESPKAAIRPVARERIIAINNIPIKDIEDYYDVVNELKPNQTITVRTNKEAYKLTTKEEKNKTTIDLGIRIYDAPKNNIKKGLELQGGTRVLLQPEEKLDENTLEDLILNMEQRLNVYGLSDIVLKKASDLPVYLGGSGKQFIVVEIAGANEEEVRNLLAKQGKFEAKVGNETVFIGGNDITYVCRSANCAGIDPNTGCSQSGNQWFCRFRFSIALDPKAAERQAEATKDLDLIPAEEGSKREYLSEKLVLFLDDVQVDELNIGADLKGRAVTDIEISGSGVGISQNEAVFNALKNMKKLQTILITGSLPVKLNIVKIDVISPVVGEEFIKNALLVGLLAIIAVAIVIFIRYRKLKVTIPMALTTIFEVTILLGLSSLINWNLDLAAIAGIIVVVGTGIDHQIVIVDETLKGEISQIFDWKKRFKRAFFIIMVAYFTTVVAMLPLIRAGAGLLKGFAITTIMGVSIGVFITRPAFASIIEILLKE